MELLASQIEVRKELQARPRSLKSESSVPDGGRKTGIRNEVTWLKCTLMHKRIDVAKIELDDATGII